MQEYSEKKPKGCKVGYVRVSSLDQNPERQLDGLELHHCFVDRYTGKNRERPKLQEMLRFIRMGDEICIHSMDRLARNLEDLLHLVKEILDKGCSVHFMKEKIDFYSNDENPMGKLILSVFGAIAEFERALIKERQREGIEIAKRKGKYKGKPCSVTADQSAQMKQMLENCVTKAAIARHFGLHVNTVRKYLECA